LQSQNGAKDGQSNPLEEIFFIPNATTRRLALRAFFGRVPRFEAAPSTPHKWFVRMAYRTYCKRGGRVHVGGLTDCVNLRSSMPPTATSCRGTVALELRSPSGILVEMHRFLQYVMELVPMTEVVTVERGFFWTIARLLYKRVTGTELSEAEQRAFVASCPPFRAVCFAMAMGWYNFALKIPQPNEPEPPGRNDLLMAVYLPYCGRFVAKDWPQERDLRQIANHADIACEILSFRNFSDGFSPLVGATSSSLANLTL